MLNALGYGLEVDGVHGPATDAAVRDFQGKHGLTVDGLIGPATLDALAHNQPAPGATKPVLQVGSTGQIVSELQAFLNRVYPAYSSLVVDGDFGPATEAVVKEFQRRSGITADGIVGPVTWSHLGM
jgi:peptidoglycan hydrolase-like protein with peptidoglycan-binding domain